MIKKSKIIPKKSLEPEVAHATEKPELSTSERRKIRDAKKPLRPVIRISSRSKKASQSSTKDTGLGGENGGVGESEYDFDRVMAKQKLEREKRGESITVEKGKGVINQSVKKSIPTATINMSSPIEKQIYALKKLQKKVLLLRSVNNYFSNIPEDSEFPELKAEVEQLISSFVQKVVKRLEDSIS